jgi:hypothetical protein
LREGIELHVLQLTFGISFWPPRLELPFLPESPWSQGVDTPHIDIPSADQFVVLTDAGYMSLLVGSEGLPDKGSWLIEYTSADAWIWFEYEWIAPGAAEPAGGFRIHECSTLPADSRTSRARVAWDPLGTALYDADSKAAT